MSLFKASFLWFKGLICFWWIVILWYLSKLMYVCMNLEHDWCNKVFLTSCRFGRTTSDWGFVDFWIESSWMILVTATFFSTKFPGFSSVISRLEPEISPIGKGKTSEPSTSIFGVLNVEFQQSNVFSFMVFSLFVVAARSFQCWIGFFLYPSQSESETDPQRSDPCQAIQETSRWWWCCWILEEVVGNEEWIENDWSRIEWNKWSWFFSDLQLYNLSYVVIQRALHFWHVYGVKISSDWR